jgi:hypothetical protein
MKRSLLTGALVTAAAACWHKSPSITLPVDPPIDNSCIGVAGFVVTIRPVGHNPVIQSLPNPSPVLSRDACRLPYDVSAPDIDVAVPIDVTVDGYDSVQRLRVTGTLRIPSLDDPGDRHLTLAAAGDTSAGILVLDRTAALVGHSLADVTDIQISAKSQNCANANSDIVSQISVTTAPFFTASPTGAFAAPRSAIATLTTGSTVFVCLYFGTAAVQGTPYTVSVVADGYWRADP